MDVSFRSFICAREKDKSLQGFPCIILMMTIDISIFIMLSKKLQITIHLYILLITY